MGSAPLVVAAGARSMAIERHKRTPGSVLLLDSEGPAERTESEAIYQMVQVMESWFLADTATTVGGGVAAGAAAVGSGVTAAAGTVSRSFRSLDIDGDGILDEAQALTAIKGAGTAILGAKDAVVNRIAGLLKSKKGS